MAPIAPPMSAPGTAFPRSSPNAAPMPAPARPPNTPSPLVRDGYGAYTCPKTSPARQLDKHSRKIAQRMRIGSIPKAELRGSSVQATRPKGTGPLPEMGAGADILNIGRPRQEELGTLRRGGDGR